MITIFYTATVDDSAVSPAFVTGTEYTVTFTASTITKSHGIIRSQSRSLGGQSETLKHRDEEFYDITTGVIETVDLPAVRNFLDSVMDGSTFNIDINSDSPLDLLSAEMESVSYAESRYDILDIFKISFKIRLI
jgi:hypothetical protein